MSKSVKSNLWFFRVDGPKDHLVAKSKELSGKIDIKRIIVAYHVGSKKENPHLHACVELSTMVQKQSFAIRIKTLYGVEARSQYALSVWDGKGGEGALSYLYHEETSEILHNKGFTEEELEAAKKANKAVQAIVNINKEKASNKFIDRAMEQLKPDASQREIFDLLFKLSKSGEVYWPGSFRAKTMIEEVYIRLSTDEAYAADYLYSKIFR